MPTNASSVIPSSIEEFDSPASFCEWLKLRRKELRLTQGEVAERASCSVHALRKIEAGDRRPSRQLAELLARALEIPAEYQITFVKTARGEVSIERLPSPDLASTHDSRPAIRSEAVPGNIPASLTAFIGREPEQNTLSQLLRDPGCSLLTIIGSGGIGKTRLAIEAVNQVRNIFPDGVWFISLAAVTSPVLLVQAIADALDFRFQDQTRPQAQLLHYLRDKSALLLLDNAEHLSDGLVVITEIIKNCRQVKLLVTSRQRLNLLSEWVFEIQGLPVPTSEAVEHFEAYSSVALFLLSARRAQADFKLSQDERRWVLKICKTLEGLPLGIELSAAWAGLLSCEEIAKEIEHNLDFLSVSTRDIPERHRSLRATLDYSWKLLNAEEKAILSRLSVFRGGFNREAAEVVCGAGLVVLSSLRDKTLLYRTGQNYYALHEIVRQYAELKLADDPDENERVNDRHAEYYVQCLSDWEKALKSSQQVEIFNKIAEGIDNLSVGWQRMITHCRPKGGICNQAYADLIHRSLFSISLFYEMRCRSWEAITVFTEAVEYLKAVQGDYVEPEDSIRFFSVLGHITAYLGLHHLQVLHYGIARKHLEEALQLLEDSGSKVERASAQIILAALDYREGQFKRSAILHEQSLAVFKEAGDRWWYLLTLINLARTYLPLGKIQESEALYQEGFRLIEVGDLRLELTLRIGYAHVRYLQNDYARAEQLMQDNLVLSYHFGNLRMTALVNYHLSQVAMSTNRVDLAEKYLQEGVNLLSEIGETDDLAIDLLNLGKCFVIRSDLDAAREKFRQVIKIGHTLDTFYLVYWALVNIARAYMDEGKVEKALEVSLLLMDCPVEHKIAQDESKGLLADLQAALPEGQVTAAMQQMEKQRSPDQATAYALNYAYNLL